MTRALLLTGGLGHPADASTPSLQRALPTVDFEIHTDVEAGLAALGNHDLLIVNVLAFAMTPARYDDVRAAWAFSLSAEGQERIEAWHARGKPILVLHTGVISFDAWSRWPEITGARWDWDRSFHPPLGECTVVIGDRTVTLTDESYRDLDVATDVEVVATTVIDGEHQPVAWTRTVDGRGPVAVDLLGHDARSLDDPAHRDLISGLTAWLLARSPEHEDASR